jgi:hypothetical protein
MLQEAIAVWHDLLTPTLAAASQARLDEQQRRRGLVFGEKPLCNVLRPRFLSAELDRFLADRVRILMEAFRIVHQAAVDDPGFRKQFHLTPEEELLFALDPGFSCPMPTSRLDAFFVPGGAGGRAMGELRFTEYNAETPAGATYADGLAEVFLTLPIMAEFQKRFHTMMRPVRPGILNALLTGYQEWLGRCELPRIGILDWKEVPTYSEFLLFQGYFREHGLECIIADPREVEYRDGRLWAGDFEITLVYKRVLVSELIARCGVDNPLVRAVRDRAACMINPFRCKALYKKASLAVLSDEANTHLFNPEQQEIIDAHIPWTRVVEERRTHLEGETIDLVPYILDNREQLVLKPNDDYGGRGIVLGWTVDSGAWERAINTALATPYIVQERVKIATEPFPAWVEGRLHVGERMLDTAPYVNGGEYMDGCLTRISTDPLLNVSAGGGSTVPTFVIERR